MDNSEKTITFIEKARRVHGDKYDYSSTQYLSARKKVIIICPVHGYFSQSPDNHLRNRGCPKCRGKGLSNNDFLQEALKVHGMKYNYSHTNYKNKGTLVEIICATHGIFRQLPSVHLKGSGCPKCVGMQFSFDEIVKMARCVHGDKYEYHDLSSERTKTGRCRNYITIYCSIHNHTWRATTDNHISKGTGCNLCGNESSSASQRGDIHDIKNRIESTHPSYTVPIDQKFINQNTNIVYLCELHGRQRGRPINLLNGEGCPVCGQEKRNTFFRDEWESVIIQIEGKFPEYHIYREQSFDNHHSPIVYRCSKHGDKISTANALLSKGAGCDECGYTKRSESQKSLWLNVADKIETIHVNITVPREQKYLNTKTHIAYHCKLHGEKYAAPSHLLQGRGCPQCAIENRNNYSDTAWCKLCGKRDAKLYWLKMTHKNHQWYKFGRTFQELKDRWWELKKKNIEYSIVKVIIRDPEYICKLERRILRLYKARYYIPPIVFGGHLTECISIGG